MLSCSLVVSALLGVRTDAVFDYMNTDLSVPCKNEEDGDNEGPVQGNTVLIHTMYLSLFGGEIPRYTHTYTIHTEGSAERLSRAQE